MKVLGTVAGEYINLQAYEWTTGYIYIDWVPYGAATASSGTLQFALEATVGDYFYQTHTAQILIDSNLDITTAPEFHPSVLATFLDDVEEQVALATESQEEAARQAELAAQSAIDAEQSAESFTDIKNTLDLVKGTGWVDENLVDHEERITILEGNSTVEGIDEKIKTQSEMADFTSTSGLDSITIKDAINEIYAEKAAANGLASLDATGKIPSAQLPVSAMEYKGTWDASSGAYPVSPDTGDFWKVSVVGITSGVEFDVGDAIVYNGTSWDKFNQIEIAEEVSYNNSGSGLISTNVQDAINELDGDITTIKGTGWTNETIKGNADNIDSLEAIVTELETVGASAYEIAVSHGFEGTEEEWLASLQGPQGVTGEDGTTAYENAVSAGYTGTEAEFSELLASLGDLAPALDAINGEVV
jgi:hypothetical protein